MTVRRGSALAAIQDWTRGRAGSKLLIPDSAEREAEVSAGQKTITNNIILHVNGFNTSEIYITYSSY